MTYYALISLFPLVIFMVSLAAFFVADPDNQQRLIDELMQALPLTEEDGRGALEQTVAGVVSNRGALGLIGLAATAYTAGALFTSVRVALNGVFHVERQRPFVIGKAIDLGLVAGFGLLLLASFALTLGIAFAQRQADALVGEDLATLVAWLANLAYLLVPPLVTGLVFLLLYTTVARGGYQPREVLPGVIVAALLFELLKIGFAQYVASFGNYDATYGTLGFVIILLLFFNLSAQVMLVGAEVARANAEVRDLERRARPMETVLRVRRSTAAFLERAHRWPVLGRLVPRDRAGALIEVIAPAPELELSGSDRAAWLRPAERAASSGSDVVDAAVPGDESSARTTSDATEAHVAAARPASGFGRWALLTGLGAFVAVWLSERKR